MPILGIIASSVQKTPASSFESIASVTPTGTKTITFSSIPSTYTSLQIRYSVLTATAGDDVFYRFNSDSGSNYARHFLSGDGSSASAFGQFTETFLVADSGSADTGTTQPMTGIIDVHNYASTTQYKTTRGFNGVDKNGSGFITLNSGLWMSTSAINSITLYTATYNYAAGTTFALYGIK